MLAQAARQTKGNGKGKNMGGGGNKGFAPPGRATNPPKAEKNVTTLVGEYWSSTMSSMTSAAASATEAVGLGGGAGSKASSNSKKGP
jgi:hypothetical protein